MRIQRTVVMLLLVLAYFALPSRADEASSREEVLNAWHALNEASIKPDIAALERLYADDYIFVSYRGTVENKTHQIELFRTGTMKFSERTPSELNVRMFGSNMAIIVYRRHQAATVGGASRPSDVRVTNVWLNRNGRWQLVSGQVTPVLSAPSMNTPR